MEFSAAIDVLDNVDRVSIRNLQYVQCVYECLKLRSVFLGLGDGFKPGRLLSSFNDHVTVGDNDISDLHVSVDHDAASPLIDHNAGLGFRIVGLQLEKVRHELDDVFLVEFGDFDHNICRVDGLHMMRFLLEIRLPDCRHHFGYGLEIRMILIQDQRNQSVLSKGSEDVFFHLTTIVDASHKRL